MELKPELLNNYLSVEVLGRFTLEEANRAADNLFEILATTGVDHVLVDCRPLEGGITRIEQFYHAKHFAESLQTYLQQGVKRNVRFAYVATGEFEDSDKFAETVAVNRFVNVRVFEDADEALEWLLASTGGGGFANSAQKLLIGLILSSVYCRFSIHPELQLNAP